MSTKDLSEHQEQFHLHPPVGSGADELGEYDLVPLSMLKGGKLESYKVYRHPMRHIVNDSSPSPRGWYKDKQPPSSRQRPRPCYSEALLTTPYGGFCHVGCRFCYVDNGVRGYRSTGLPTVNPGYPEKLKAQLERCLIAPIAYISSFTEPFQLLESQYHVTQRISNYLLEMGLPLFYLTRRIPPSWAVDILGEHPFSYMQWSINTSNQDDLHKLSPGMASLDDILESIANLAARHIYVSVQCNPVLPGITRLSELVDLVKLVHEAGARHIIFKFAEQTTGTRKLLIDRLSAAGLRGVGEFDALLSQMIGGVYTVRQDVRVAWLKWLLEVTRSEGITMSTCYEYYDDGGAGANMAPWFTTADQCHGRGVPMFYREDTSEKFEPLPGCYRKGCLYCREYGTRACGSEALLSAKALTYKDFQTVNLEQTRNEAAHNVGEACYPAMYAWRSEAVNPGWVTDAELWGLGELP